MAKSKKEKEFERKVKALIEEADRLKDDAVKRVMRMLERARKEVAAEVASTEWEIYRQRELQTAVKGALTAFGDQYGVQIRADQREFWEHGIDMVDQPLKTVGIKQAMPMIDNRVLSILQDYSSDLVTNLSADAVKKINNEIAMSLMGQKTPYEAMQAIGRSLTEKGIFKTIMDRAEAITRTEGGRVLSAASQKRKEAAATVVPGLQKEWRHSHIARVPRLSHLAAEGQRVDVDQPFRVGGEKLMYPRDPAGSAANTIRCE